MRYEDHYDGYNYDYDELVENTEDLGLDEEPWMDGYEDSEEDDDEVDHNNGIDHGYGDAQYGVTLTGIIRVMVEAIMTVMMLVMTVTAC